MTFEQIFTYLIRNNNDELNSLGSYSPDIQESDEEVSPEAAGNFMRAFQKAFNRGKESLGDYLAVELMYHKALKLSQIVKRIVLRRKRSRPSIFVLNKKRKPYQPFVFGKIKEEKGKIAVLIDSSGSMLMEIGDKTLLDIAASMVYSTFKNNKKVDIYYGDTDLYDPVKVSRIKDAKGGGETAMDKLYIKLKNKNIYKNIIVVTDGETEFPPPSEMRNEDLFVILTDVKPPKHIPSININLRGDYE